MASEAAAAMKAVFWDFGGVVTSSPFEAFRAYEASHGLPRDFIRSVNAHDPDTTEERYLDAAAIMYLASGPARRVLRR